MSLPMQIYSTCDLLTLVSWAWFCNEGRVTVFPGHIPWCLVFLSSSVWGNIPSNHSTKSDIEHKIFGGLETNHKCMSIIIVQKRV